MDDVADPDEYARAMRAISGVKGLDPSKGGDQDLRRALAISRGEPDPLIGEHGNDENEQMQRALEESQQMERISRMTIEQQMAYAIAESAKSHSSANNGGPGPSTTSTTTQRVEQYIDLMEEDDIGDQGMLGVEQDDRYRNRRNDESNSGNQRGRLGSSSESNYESVRGSSSDVKLDLPAKPKEWSRDSFRNDSLPSRPPARNKCSTNTPYLISDSDDETEEPNTMPGTRVPTIGTPLRGAKNREMQRRQAAANALLAMPTIRPAEGPICIDGSDDEEIVAGPGPATTAQRNANQKSHTKQGMQAAAIAVAAGQSLLRPVDEQGYRDVLQGIDRRQLALAAHARRQEKRKREDTPSEDESNSSDDGENDEQVINSQARRTDKKQKRRIEDTAAFVATETTAHRLDGRPVAHTANNDLDGPTGAQALFQRAIKVDRLVGDTYRPERGDMCWDGEVRSTWIAASRTRSTRKAWRIGDIIGDKGQLSLVICAAFCWDDEWVTRQFPDMTEVPFIRIMTPSPNTPRISVNDTHDPNRMPRAINCAPFMPGYGCMHMKFMLLFYKSGRLRLVVSSANMVEYDWERIENIAFVQDLMPINKEVKRTDLVFPDHDIPRTLRKLFSKFSVSPALQHAASVQLPGKTPVPLSGADDYLDLSIWDWTKVKAQMVISEPGNFIGAQADAIGMTRLSKIVRDQGWLPKDGEDIVADFQSSSLMEFRERWSDIFHRCLKGTDPTEIGRILGPVRKQKKDHKPVWPPIKVLFPSLNTVDRSHGGRPGGGTMFCKDKKHFRPDTKRLFYDANSLSGRNLQHTKMIIARFVYKKIAKHYIDVEDAAVTAQKATRPVQTLTGPIIASPSAGEGSTTLARKDEFLDRQPINLDPEADKHGMGGWWYMGSHNFSKAAWGQLSWHNSVPKLFVNNYEMGLVFPIARPDIDDAVQRIVPWQHPPRKYGRKDVPWMQEVHMPQTEAGMAQAHVAALIAQQMDLAQQLGAQGGFDPMD